MQDFPFFSTQYGVSSLSLKEIPYRQEAYIRIRQVQEDGFQAHLDECVRFCVMAGAERIYAADHGGLEQFTLHASMLEMRGQAVVDREKLACLFPVTEATVSRWRGIYNERMAQVDMAETLEAREEGRILESGGAYFVHRAGQLLGIGWLDGCKLLVVASARKGEGETVMHTLMSLVEGDTLTLEVASTNARAIRLYEKLGFVKTAERTRWYRVR